MPWACVSVASLPPTGECSEHTPAAGGHWPRREPDAWLSAHLPAQPLRGEMLSGLSVLPAGRLRRRDCELPRSPNLVRGRAGHGLHDLPADGCPHVIQYCLSCLCSRWACWCWDRTGPSGDTWKAYGNQLSKGSGGRDTLGRDLRRTSEDVHCGCWGRGGGETHQGQRARKRRGPVRTVALLPRPWEVIRVLSGLWPGPSLLPSAWRHGGWSRPLPWTAPALACLDAISCFSSQASPLSGREECPPFPWGGASSAQSQQCGLPGVCGLPCMEISWCSSAQVICVTNVTKRKEQSRRGR